MPRYFTLEEANDHVPWVKNLAEQALPIRRRHAMVREELAGVLGKSRGNGSAHLQQASATLQRELGSLQESLSRLIEQISRAGIILRDVDRGLVDFPHIREGREVHLCWQLGEERIGYWHEVDAGFAGRQPL